MSCVKTVPDRGHTTLHCPCFDQPTHVRAGPGWAFHIFQGSRCHDPMYLTISGPYYTYRTYHDMLHQDSQANLPVYKSAIARIKQLPIIAAVYLFFSYFFSIEVSNILLLRREKKWGFEREGPDHVSAVSLFSSKEPLNILLLVYLHVFCHFYQGKQHLHLSVCFHGHNIAVPNGVFS